MNLNTPLLLSFLIANVFLIGVFATIAVRHALAHFRPRPHDEAPAPKPVRDQAHLSPAAKERLMKAAEVHFEAVLTHAAGEFHRDLKATADKLNKQLTVMGATVIEQETKQYRANLAALNKQLETALTTSQNDLLTVQASTKTKLVEEQAALDAKLAQDLAAEKERLLAQIDTKLADAVSSFLIETLQHNVDLGAQTAYLTSMLDEHKAELAKELTREA